MASVRTAFLIAALVAVGSCTPAQPSIPSELTFEEWAARELSNGGWTLTEMDGHRSQSMQMEKEKASP
jgi:hypothetical protein